MAERDDKMNFVIKIAKNDWILSSSNASNVKDDKITRAFGLVSNQVIGMSGIFAIKMKLLTQGESQHGEPAQKEWVNSNFLWWKHPRK